MKLINKHSLFARTIYISIAIIITSIFLTNPHVNAFEFSDIELIGKVTLPKGLTFKNTEVGGLSGITYDGKSNFYYAISDDRGEKAPPRFYTFTIDLTKGKLENSDVAIAGVTTLLNTDNQPFPKGQSDTEGIALTNNDTVFISSEGHVAKSINPFIQEFSLDSGQVVKTLSIPNKFLPDKSGKQGIRDNLAFESLTITPDNQHLFTATENALIQDGTAAKSNLGSLCRILQYNLLTNKLEKEFLYQTEPVAEMFNITGRFASGLTDLLALDNQGNFLSIERSFNGLGFLSSLFQVSLVGADQIQNMDSFLAVNSQKFKPVKKKPLLQNLDVLLDNIEGLTLGPWLPDGNRALILISDNNFNSLQTTQIIAFKLKTKSPMNRLLRRLIPR
ncbi:esterase-like activity of phytase family protein [Umezakia ovalisporum]|jgi:hypothetical protein|uniref:esterase-like activity of phytase family protein n=1 Tax=Umezakia ovalisporum TaxID=75695 RepID=UPI0024751381|nr:esterase-like activity of phytase family protein [Umezakia ovalisporum]MDH6085045.1 esterase-like activity of phytase family protein [Umezakia ovalisporum TAC611]MDH6087403.1 esterase-like activity of phytase family protein [Umezakia ovalisporum Ak1311]